MNIVSGKKDKSKSKKRYWIIQMRCGVCGQYHEMCIDSRTKKYWFTNNSYENDTVVIYQQEDAKSKAGDHVILPSRYIKV